MLLWNLAGGFYRYCRGQIQYVSTLLGSLLCFVPPQRRRCIRDHGPDAEDV